MKDPAVGEGDDPYRGLKWGLGVAFSSHLGGVGSVTVDGNKVVRVTKENTGAARGAFEVHYFFKMCNGLNNDDGRRAFYLPNRYDERSRKWECDNNSRSRNAIDPGFGMGPFVSLNTSPIDSGGGNKVFDSLGVGWMMGVNAFDNSTTVHTLNIGVGVILDTSVKTLAPGVVNGQLTNITDQNLLTTQTTKTGWMMMMSYKLFDTNLK